MSITAPYNFVPLSEQVFFPDWADQVSHDVPFEDGISGTLALKITAHTPLLIGDRQTKNEQGSTVVTPFKLPPKAGETEGRYAIPGTSLRGMVRNVLEIASFGKMQRVDDRRYAVRDLSADFYKSLLTKGSPHKGIFFNSESGWLKYQDNKWTITVCKNARVEQKDLQSYQKKPLTQDINAQDEASAKYNLWTESHESLEISFDTTDDIINQKSRHKLPLHYRLAANLGKGEKTGKLVFTGQAGKKHMEFIFYESEKTIPVPKAIIENFLFTYADTHHWKYLKKHEMEEGIPVFFLRNGQVLHSIGLSQMYKVAYKNTIYDAIGNTTKDHLDESKRDLAELIFGYTNEQNNDDEIIEQGLKGRVSFSHAVCDQEEIELTTKTTILNSPKPTYYPNYIQQDETAGILNGEDKAKYNTLMDPNVQLRGWKRYPVRPTPKVPTPDPEQSEAVQSVITALNSKSGLSFTAKIRFHNLKAIELGAIIWSVQWGDNEDLRHAIGMGKTFGYGQLKLEILDDKSQLFANNEEFSLTDCIQKYREHMNRSIEKWEISEQLYQLTKMADPKEAPGNNDVLEHMELEEYLNNKNDKSVLSKYAIQTTPESWLSANIKFMVGKNSSLDANKLYFQAGLAKKWQSNIADPVLKVGVRDCIKNHWNEVRGDGFWDKPIGKKTIEVRNLYDE